MKKQEGGMQKWEREAAEDKGKDAIGLWRKAFKESKDKRRMEKIMESKSAKDYRRWWLDRSPRYLKLKGNKNKGRMIARFTGADTNGREKVL